MVAVAVWVAVTVRVAAFDLLAAGTYSRWGVSTSGCLLQPAI